MSLPEFKPFSSIPRLFRGCAITEKIDGTNALVHIGHDGTVTAGSRSRWITPEDDNCGFARWVARNADELRGLGPGYHYGEWWGAGIQRRYDIGEKRFSLFNVARWHQRGAEPYLSQPLDPRKPPKSSTDAPACCHVVPVLARGTFTTSMVIECLDRLARSGSVAAPGYSAPEGVCVYHEASGGLFKATLGGDGHKGGAR